MDKAKGISQRHSLSKRRLIQLYAALMYNAHLKGFIRGEIYTGNVKAVCVPGLNCYSCPGAVAACPLGALQNALASSGARAPWYVLGILLLFGITLGRTVCGWLCPVGLLQEALYRLPGPKLRKSRFTRALSRLRYAVLAVFAVALPLFSAGKDIPLPAFCKYICPAGTLEGALPLLAHPANAGLFSMLGALFAQKWIILLLFVLSAVFICRAFCRFLCPLGAIYGLFNRICLVGVRVDASSCTGCGRCVKQCRMDVRRVGDSECIHCGECAAACPEGAISFRAGKRTLRSADIPPRAAKPSRRPSPAVVRALLLLPLLGALLYFNFGYAGPEAPQPASAQARDAAVPVGHGIGERAPDFTLTTLDGDAWTLSEHRGKTVVLNFWATWCAPCVRELPYFQQLQEEWGDDAAILAVHSDLVTDDVNAWLDKKGFTIPFAVDTAGVITLLGGSAMLPQTVVVDRDGIVIENRVGSMTPETLGALMRQAAGP